MKDENQRDKLVTCEFDGIVYKGRQSVYMNGKTNQVFIDGRIVGIDCDENGDDLRWSHPIPQAESITKSRWRRFCDFFMGISK